MAGGVCALLDRLTFVLMFCSFLFYAIALGLPKWSTGYVTVSGDDTDPRSMDIGLWIVCVATSANAQQDVFHSGSSDCRVGHCPVQSQLSRGADWDSHNLCERSKASAAFDIFGFICTFLFFYFTLIHTLRGHEQQSGLAVLFGLLAGLSGIIAFAVWVDWQKMMNNDDTRLTGLVTFSTLSTGPAVGLVIAAWVFNIVASVQYYISSRNRPKADSRQAARVNENDDDLDMDDPLHDLARPRTTEA